ncbi:MAG: sigma-70 family RNA polymerase sigma factor [Thermoleophilia bacterium]|jgi:RNA polymerase sigma-70 factor (ECF subfamily)|nr:sigma-70 family RNA polymerase sigma factor [Thermoleophilia bacterium]
MLGSPFDAEDAVQDTMLRAWRARERFEGRATVRSWLYRIATNVCTDMLASRGRRARPMDLGPAGSATGPVGPTLPEATWVEPVPDRMLAGPPDPAEVAEGRETLRLALVAALQHLPPRQRAVLILCEVLHWRAAEVAALLDTTVASVNSALQRARATLSARGIDAAEPAPEVDTEARALLDRYVDAFQRYDMDALTALIRDDAVQSMPPYALWVAGREEILAFWTGPGAGCRGSRVVPAPDANGLPAFGQYRPRPDGDGHDPWALQVVRPGPGGIAEFAFFLDTTRIFPLFGLPDHLPRR